MAVEVKKPKKQSAGAPGWMATFADLMSLLLCFFILLLTFSEIDAAKFKQTSGSLKMAFGVQRDERFDVLPMGTSIVAQEYSPGAQQLVDFDILGEAFKGTDDNNLERRDKKLLEQEMQISFDNLLSILQHRLKAEVERGEVELLKGPEKKVIVRIPADRVFHGDSTRLQREFAPTLIKISRVSEERAKHVAVLGHVGKEEVPGTYRSKWDQSTQMASSLTSALIEFSKMDPGKFLVLGHADTRPLDAEAKPEKQEFKSRIEMILVPDPAKM